MSETAPEQRWADGDMDDLFPAVTGASPSAPAAETAAEDTGEEPE